MLPPGHQLESTANSRTREGHTASQLFPSHLLYYVLVSMPAFAGQSMASGRQTGFELIENGQNRFLAEEVSGHKVNSRQY
jgi:hypothetical protein